MDLVFIVWRMATRSALFAVLAPIMRHGFFKVTDVLTKVPLKGAQITLVIRPAAPAAAQQERM